MTGCWMGVGGSEMQRVGGKRWCMDIWRPNGKEVSKGVTSSWMNERMWGMRAQW